MKTATNAMLAILALPLAVSETRAADDGLEFHDDYYRGFSQGAYYGLMLAGEDYHVAWCMKAELEYEAQDLGSGGDFQKKLEELLRACRAAAPAQEED